MINTIHRLKEFLKYQQKAKTKYYLHSPFVYQFYCNILEGELSTEIQNIKKLHKKLLHTKRKILINDLGAQPGQKERSISQIAANSCIPGQYGEVLYRLVKYFKPLTILELGTCLGEGTAYLASAGPSSSIITIEGSQTLVEEAKANFHKLGFNNIDTRQGNFDDLLPDVLNDIAQIDLAYIDGNHRYEPTMRYFRLIMGKAHDNTILIFDDIYWSPEMTRAWEKIKEDPRITLTMDIYRFGIAFMHTDKLSKEDFILWY